VSLGRPSEARPLVALLDAMADRLGRPSTMAAAATARGLVLAASGDPAGGLEALALAVAIHETLSMPFERAKLRLAAGRIRRRARSKRLAHADLAAAADGFAAIGAGPWAAIAADEARRIGGRPVGSPGLTPAEERVARLVADGRSNKEVASTLVVTVKTVEATLTRLYGKLGLGSRTELVRWVLEHDRSGVEMGTM
jgi:DNA-binding NarL/FixJ family response regulator